MDDNMDNNGTTESPVGPEPTPPMEPTPPPPPPPAPATGYQPSGTGAVPGEKSKVVAGVLGILLGSLGIHKFYLGYMTEGIILLAVTIVSFGFLSFVTGVIGLIEGILYLTKTDEEFEQTYVVNKKKWF